MNLVIHAGIHRTGTSSLQDFLSSNRDALGQRGILYAGEAKNHQQLAWAIKRKDAGGEEILNLIQSGQATCETAVLSAEDFCIHKDLGWLADIADKLPVSVHFYLRRQDHWLMSWYNQHIKWPFDKWKSQMSPEEFLECIDDFYWIDFASLVQRWEQILGADSVQVSVVESGQVEDVTVDFLQHIGVDPEELATPAKRANNSMPVHLLNVARHLGLHGMTAPQRIKVLGALNRSLPRSGPLPKTVYTPEQRRHILGRYAASNRQLAEKLFHRQELFLEPPPSDSDPFYQSPDIPRDEFLREWVGPIIHELSKR